MVPRLPMYFLMNNDNVIRGSKSVTCPQKKTHFVQYRRPWKRHTDRDNPFQPEHVRHTAWAQRYCRAARGRKYSTPSPTILRVYTSVRFISFVRGRSRAAYRCCFIDTPPAVTRYGRRKRFSQTPFFEHATRVPEKAISSYRGESVCSHRILRRVAYVTAGPRPSSWTSGSHRRCVGSTGLLVTTAHG